MKKFLILMIFLSANFYCQEVLDKIVAKVGNEIILKSELEMQVNYFAIQRNLNPNDPRIKEQILKSMIEEKLLYAQAEIDSITVSEDDVTMQLENQLNYFIQQYGSRERVEEAYGMSIERIKRELRDDMKKNIMVQQIKQKKFGNVNISRHEVEEFYFEYKDSLGLIPERYQLAHIFKNPTASERLKKKIREKAQMLLDSLKKGADFAALAKEYSEDPGSAKNGGDLGSVRRGIFFPEFEAAAFKLQPGELSDIVETPVGYHIIQLLDKKGETIHTRHILLKIKPDDEADLQVISELNEIRDSIVRFGKDFVEMAKKYSDDKETAKFGGDLGNLEIGQMKPGILSTVKGMKEGEISYPKRIELNRDTYGYNIVWLKKHVPEHRATLEQDYDDIKKLAEFNKQQKLYKKLISDLKDKVFVEVNL